MRQLLNTLYVTKPESYLYKDGMNVVISVNQVEVFRIPIINIEAIVTFGYMGASPGLMKLCCDKGVSITFMTPSGRFISRIQGKTKGNVLLRKIQYSISEDKVRSLHLVSLMTACKIQNSVQVLRRYQREYGPDEEIDRIINRLCNNKDSILCADNHDTVRGIEGDAASAYFSVFNRLILKNKDFFTFEGRNRRPPKDPTNAMLSLAYTLLANEIQSALETVGLDPFVGFFHALRPGRPSLALDVMEEFRAFMCDRFVLSLINRQQVSENDFMFQGEEGVLLTDNGRKVFLTAWQNRKKETIIHPFLKEKVEIGLLPYVQAMLLARYLRGEIDDYPVFFFK